MSCKSRLRKQADFDRVFTGSRKVENAVFVLLYKKNDLLHARLGVAISKSKVRRAVDRNKVKRKVRESFRKRAAQFLHVDAVVIVKSASVLQSLGSIDELWQKIS